MVSIAPVTLNRVAKDKAANSQSVGPFNASFFASGCNKPDVFEAKNNSAKISFSGLILKPGLFKDVAANETNALWSKLIARETKLYPKPNETRSEFFRDYNRILHSNAYNKLYGKTQVFITPKDPTISTRGPHSNQVACVAEDFAEFMGLNPMLARCSGTSHDVGHTPLGHDGEKAIDVLSRKHLGVPFWHEKNSLRVVDDIETKLDTRGFQQNLDLTYAVRDGIVCHCGEMDEIFLKPRSEYIDLRSIQKTDKNLAFTWGGCLVRVSDKISYLGKDLEDSLQNKFLNPNKIKELIQTIKQTTGEKFKEINNTVLINRFMSDIKANSNPDAGIRFSEEGYEVYKAVKKFNYENIYTPVEKRQTPYIEVVINTVFEDLDKLYDGKNTLAKINSAKETRPVLMSGFRDWLVKYSDIAPKERASKKLANKILYNIDNPKDYKLATLEYIASMTDRKAIEAFEEVKIPR